MNEPCFDCGKKSWGKYERPGNRTFCKECYDRRLHPERSKREDCFEDFKEWGHEMITIPLSDECWCVKCEQPNFVIRSKQMRCSEH